MLLELAAFNTAFGTIKKFVENGKDIGSALSVLGNLVGAEEDLRAKANRKQAGLFSKLMGKSAEDFDEFLALDEIKQKKAELKSMIQIYGRAGLWDDYQKWEAQARVKRRKEAEERERQKAVIMQWVFWGATGAIVIVGVGSLVLFAEFLKGL